MKFRIIRSRLKDLDIPLERLNKTGSHCVSFIMYDKSGNEYTTATECIFPSELKRAVEYAISDFHRYNLPKFEDEK